MPQLLYPREIDPVPIIQEDVWVSGPVWAGTEKSRTPPGTKPRTFQPVAILYTNYAIPAANTHTYGYTLRFRLYRTANTVRFY